MTWAGGKELVADPSVRWGQESTGRGLGTQCRAAEPAGATPCARAGAEAVGRGPPCPVVLTLPTWPVAEVATIYRTHWKAGVTTQDDLTRPRPASPSSALVPLVLVSLLSRGTLVMGLVLSCLWKLLPSRICSDWGFSRSLAT